MIRVLYRALLAALRLVVPPLLRVAGVRDRKLARALAGRLRAGDGLAAWAAAHRDPARPLLWFHAASVGEGRQAQSVLDRLRAARPDWQVAWTFSSPSAEDLAARVVADVRSYVPADTAADTARVLDALRPSALVFAATDLWPELVRQASARRVRCALVSANLGPLSSRRGMLARALLGEAYAALDAVGAVDAADAEGLVALGVRRGVIRVTGDARHDSAAARAAAADRSRPELRALLEPGPPVVLAGSTWPADVAVLLPALASVAADVPLRIVLAPHEPAPERLAALEASCARTFPGAPIVRLSELSRSPALPPSRFVCLVDSVGLLADLYTAAAVAYVGGGFHDAGLHAVIEPAACGVPVLFGPRWRTSRDAGLLLARGGGRSAADAAALAAALRAWLADETARAAAGAAARAVVDAGIGAADRSLQLILELVERPA